MITPSDEESAMFQFRFQCRQQTRAQIRALCGQLGASLEAMWQGIDGVSVQGVLASVRQTLADQAEPDGTQDVVPCGCGATVRLPLRGAARCPKCKRILQ